MIIDSTFVSCPDRLNTEGIASMRGGLLKGHNSSSTLCFCHPCNNLINSSFVCTLVADSVRP